MIERVVEIQRMRHARIQHGRLRRRHPPLPQHHLALWRTAPAVRNAYKFSDSRRTAAFDAAIHNAGIGYREARRAETEDRLPALFATNTLAPFVLTALIGRPKRLVYLSSGMHRSARLDIDDLTVWAADCATAAADPDG
jgi:NAD(P)-dependent dehydrogenase (short-subunit alcohol dehydrogenase family)